MKRKNRFIIWIVLILFVVFLFYPFREPPVIHYVDRATGQIKTEKVMAGTGLYWLYNNPVGELTLNVLVKRKIVTELYGRYMHSHWSASKIKPFIRDYQIDTSRFVMDHFNSFNAFFIRKLKPEAQKIDTGKRIVISPVDGKCLAYADIDTASFIVKGIRFNIRSFLRNDSLARLFHGGSLLLFRLAPTDYHRYHFPLSGKIATVRKIDGYYYSVNPIAIKKDIWIFFENKRQYQIIHSKLFGNVVMSEIGATMVGSMVQTHQGTQAVKGEEDGYFQFGGSSVILLFERGKINIDTDLLKNTKSHLETSVKMGEHVATLNEKDHSN